MGNTVNNYIVLLVCREENKNMDKIQIVQREFFQTLKEIQEEVVSTALCNYKGEDDIEDILYDVTYETIYNIMELIDGYTKESLQLDIIERVGKKSLRTGIELHDTCSEYIKYEK